MSSSVEPMAWRQVGLLGAEALQPLGELAVLLDGERVDRADLAKRASHAPQLGVELGVVERGEIDRADRLGWPRRRPARPAHRRSPRARARARVPRQRAHPRPATRRWPSPARCAPARRGGPPPRRFPLQLEQLATARLTRRVGRLLCGAASWRRWRAPRRGRPARYPGRRRSSRGPRRWAGRAFSRFAVRASATERAPRLPALRASAASAAPRAACHASRAVSRAAAAVSRAARARSRGCPRASRCPRRRAMRRPAPRRGRSRQRAPRRGRRRGDRPRPAPAPRARRRWHAPWRPRAAHARHAPPPRAAAGGPRVVRHAAPQPRRRRRVHRRGLPAAWRAR